MAEMSDIYYVEMLRTDQANEALTALQEKYNSLLLRYAAHMFASERIYKLWLKDPRLTPDEVVASAWVKLYERSQEIAIENVPGYLRRVVERDVKDMARNRVSELRFEANIPDDEELDTRLQRQAEQLDARQALEDMRLMDVLYPCQRLTFILRYGFELKPQSIELLTGKSTNVISACISQARARMVKQKRSREYQTSQHKSHPRRDCADILINDALSPRVYEIDQEYLHARDLTVSMAAFILPITQPFEIKKMHFLVKARHGRGGWEHQILYDVLVEGQDIHITNRQPCLLLPWPDSYSLGRWESERGQFLQAPTGRTWEFDLCDHETSKLVPCILAYSGVDID